MNSLQLLQSAQWVLDSTTENQKWWPRAVALLTRQALESALKEWWLSNSPGGQTASFRAQLLCFVQENPISDARNTGYLWASLSRACHYNGYELPPTAQELKSWLKEVERVIMLARGE